MSELQDHEFGNVSTDLKLSLVEGYLQAFTTALRNRFDELWYVDAFAGTGERTVKTAGVPAGLLPDQAEMVERRRGSARIAIETEPRFDRLVFMDKKRKHCLALKDLAAEHPSRRIDIVRADANAAILEELRSCQWLGKRAVMFLDPYGMSLHWSTLVEIQKTEAIDVWYLVSLAGIFRQATRAHRSISADKRAALNRMLGTGQWESAWYAPRHLEADLFGHIDETIVRTADVEAMERFVAARLKSVFPAIVGPKRLRNAQNVPMFSLFLAISNPNSKAIGLATRIGNHILKA
ncbi:three-Cys-motif partner protein TcmP [Consotaella aegiceratis]|uniref:three-Cys-motif partner protein TcmP n=1 Tax=Consotaella aegiceratis TaxID=3097961 RepID=UPI002F426023